MRKGFAPVCAALLVISAFIGADEVHELVEKLKPEPRFAGYKPSFSYQLREFAFEHVNGPQTMKWYVIKDRERYVAHIPLPGFHGGTIYVLDFNPQTAPTELKMPTERWHIDTAIGTEITTGAFIPANASDENSYQFELLENGEILKLTRHYKGTATFNQWVHNDKVPQQVEVNSVFLLRCDPVHGYVVDATYDVKAERFPGRYQFASLNTSGLYSLWPGTESCYRTVVTPIGSKGYSGYYQNCAAIARGNSSCRDGGFGAFLNDVTGWSPAMTTSGADAQITVCNAHADLDFMTPVSKDMKTDEKGLKHVIHKHRLLALPPELTRYVWENMEVKFQDARQVQIRIGSLEDFEEQPLPLTTRIRGLTFTSNGPTISSEFAYSGTKSMVVDGTVWPNIPQLVLKPNRKYRLEAWIKVVPWNGEKREEAEEKAKLEIEKQRKKGKEVPDFAGLETPKAFITAHLYEWTPHSGQWLVRQQTNEATDASTEWQKVSLKFQAPAYGPFANIVFVARTCTAYFDDFNLIEIND